MAGMQTIKAIIEALRTKPQAPGIYREPGQVPRRVRGSLMGDTQSRAQFDRYRRIQSGADEPAMSYEEWLQSR